MKHNVYKKCSKIPIYNFYKLLEGGNIRYMIVDFDEDSEKVINVTEEDGKEMLTAFMDIFYEYSELTFNRKTLQSYEMRIAIASMEFRKNTAEKILDLYKEYQPLEVLDMLNDIGFKMDLDKNIENQINMVIRKVKGLRNQIKIKKSKYADLFEKDTKDIKSDLDKEAIELQIDLNMNTSIDVRTTVVTKWIKMFEIRRERAEAQSARLKKK